MSFRIKSQNRQMGISEFCLLIFISLSFVSSSSSSLHKALSSELMQEIKLKESKGIHAYKAKGGGSAGGHASGHSSGHTSPHNSGNGGESRTPTQGGGAVIPAYAAGAAGAANANDRRHQNHHGTNNGSLSRIELPTLLIITFLYTPLLHLCLFI